MKTGHNPIFVILKASNRSVYSNFVTALDEFNITSVLSYAVSDIAPKDLAMLKQRKAFQPFRTTPTLSPALILIIRRFALIKAISNSIHVIFLSIFLFREHTKKVQSKFYLCTLKKMA